MTGSRGEPAALDARWALALCSVLACALSLPPGDAAAAARVSLASGSGAAVLLAGAAVLRRGRSRSDRGGLLGAAGAGALALLCVALTAQSIAQSERRLDEVAWHELVRNERTVRVEVLLQSSPSERVDRFGVRRAEASARIERFGAQGTVLPEPVRALLSVPASAEQVGQAGDRVCLVARLASQERTTVLRGRAAPRAGGCPGASAAADPGAPATRPTEGVAGRDRMRQAFRDASAGAWADADELIPALVLGDRGTQSAQLDQAMKDAGLSHLSAVSGANCALLCGAVTVGLRSLRTHRRVVVTAVLGTLAAFVVLIGPEPSVLRAATMGGLGALAVFAGRGRQAFCLLCLAGTMLVIIEPALAVEPALHLSLAATAGIVVGARPTEVLLRRALDPLLPGWAAGWLSVSLAVTGTAHLACQPILILMTGTVSAYAVPANLAAAPLVPAVTVLGTAAAACVLIAPGLTAALLWIVQAPAGLIGAIARTVAGLPHAVRPWPEADLGVGLFVLTLAGTLVGFTWLLAHERRPRPPVRRVGGPAAHARIPVRPPVLIVLAAALSAAAAGGYTAVLLPSPAARAGQDWAAAFCDVGQGDMTLVRSGEHAAVVVDAGPEPRDARACLDALGVRRVDALLFTHLHADHTGGAEGIRDRLTSPSDIGYATSDAPEADTDAPPTGATRLSAGDRGEAGSAVWHVLHADSSAPRENDASAQVLLRTVDEHSRATTVLVTGDMQDQATARWISAPTQQPPPSAGEVDVLKVAHHGARNGGLDLPHRVRADLQVVSVGADNTYGHPHPGTVAGLARLGPVARTDVSGTLLVGWTPPDHGPVGPHRVVLDRDESGACLTVRALGPRRRAPIPARPRS